MRPGAAPSAKMTELFALAEQQVEKFFTQMTYVRLPAPHCHEIF
jgi:hypothetical protein